MTCTDAGFCVNVAKLSKRSSPAKRSDARSDRYQPDGRDEENHKARETIKKFSAALALYDRRLASYNRCIQTFDPSSNKAGCGSAPTPPNAPRFPSATFSGRGNQPRITAGQAAAIAVARLQLPRIPPGIGPSPNLNPWKVAAVGYPLWLWADGPTRVGPISDSVAGLSVSLEAEVSSLTFRMGDGHTVRCAGSGHRWTAAVQPGTKSPSCGYSYVKPSLPDDTYTVAATANWAVTWTSNGQSGVINVPVVSTTELPVGELQVLVR
ncbi:MAG TPA: hypothetical protein VJ301_20255 [Propionibacteriaceae bacterium]|nr:hypothetical protein [Propionibacteriaceae bacterium]